jgi:hypothetical protein
MLVAAAVVGLTCWRLWYGVDLTDESFYVALPWRFAGGATPFVDETTVAQQAALLVYPFVLAYRTFVGVDGVVLFVRHLEFLFSLLVGGAVVVSLRRTVGHGAALLLAACAVAFAPFDIHSLSYNTLGTGLLTVGCLLGTLPVDRRRWLAVAGISHGLAVFAYPSLAVAVAVCFAARVAVEPRRWRTLVLGYAAPSAMMAAAAMGAVVAEAGLHRVVDGYDRSTKYLGHAGSLAKLGDVFQHEWATLHFWYLLFPALALLGAAWLRRRPLALPLLLALPFLVLPGSLDRTLISPRYTATLEYVATFGALALPLAALAWRRPEARRLFAVVWLPAFAGGLATAYSSNNGSVNFGVGFFPAIFVTGALLLWLWRDSLAPRVRPPVWPVLVVPALLVALGWQLYREGPLSTLTTTAAGPYAGLQTSENKVLFLAELQRDLDRVGPSCRIAFFKDFPAGYLLSHSRPDTDSAWVLTVRRTKTAPYQQELVDYWTRHGFPDILVVTKLIPYEPRRAARTERYSAGTPLAELLASAYVRISSHYNYVMYERSGSTCQVQAP